MRRSTGITALALFVAGTVGPCFLAGCAEKEEKPALGPGEIYAPRPDNRTLKRKERDPNKPNPKGEL